MITTQVPPVLESRRLTPSSVPRPVPRGSAEPASRPFGSAPSQNIPHQRESYPPAGQVQPAGDVPFGSIPQQDSAHAYAKRLLNWAVSYDTGRSDLPMEVYQAYQTVVRLAVDSPAGRAAAKRLAEVNRAWLFQSSVPNHLLKTIVLGATPDLSVVAKTYHTTVPLLEQINKADSRALRPHRELLVPRWQGVFAVVDKSEYLLRIYTRGEELFLFSFPVAIGKRKQTTRNGTYIISNKVIRPDWYSPIDKKVVKYGSSGYPLGERWMALSRADAPTERTGLGIHGTNKPASIGTAASLGCVRMRNNDVVEVYNLIRLGSTVIIQE